LKASTFSTLYLENVENSTWRSERVERQTLEKEKMLKRNSRKKW